MVGHHRFAILGELHSGLDLGETTKKKEETLQSALKISCFSFGFGFNTSGCVLFLMHQHRSD